MKKYLQNIEKITLANENFRQVLYTGQHMQLVVMSLKPLEEIGAEVHQVGDQFFRVEAGEGKAIFDGEEHNIVAGDALVVPAGLHHNIINTSSKNSLKIYTIYSPAHHKDATIHATRHTAQADKDDHI